MKVPTRIVSQKAKSMCITASIEASSGATQRQKTNRLKKAICSLLIFSVHYTKFSLPGKTIMSCWLLAMRSFGARPGSVRFLGAGWAACASMAAGTASAHMIDSVKLPCRVQKRARALLYFTNYADS